MAVRYRVDFLDVFWKFNHALHGGMKLTIVSLRCKQFAQNKKTLLIGDSLLRYIDEGKLKATDVHTISVGRLSDVLERLQKRDEQYGRVVVCASTNDCGRDAMDDTQFIQTYKDIVQSATALVASSKDVSIASIPPRRDNQRASERVKTAKEAIKETSSQMRVTFMDNDPSFKLANGAFNDG